MLWHLVSVGALGAVIGLGTGWQACAWKADADRTAQLELAARDAARRAEHVDQAAVGYETQRAATQQRQRVITKEVERVVDRPVYRDRECLDADGLRLVAEAIGAPAPAGGAASAVPAASGSR